MKKQTPKLRILFFISYFAEALFNAFVAIFFKSKGFDGVQLGILVALIPIGSIVGNFLFHNIAKTIKRNLIIIRIACAVEFIAVGIIGFDHSFWFYFILTSVYAILDNPMFTLMDGVGVEIAREEKSTYSNVRVFGSIGYMIACLANTFFLKIFNDNFQIVFIISGVMFLVSSLITFIIDTSGVKERQEDVAFKYHYFRDKRVVLFIIFYVLCFSTTVIGSTYTSVYYQDLGMSNSEWSFANVYRVLVEVIAMFSLKYIFKDGHYKLSLILCGLSWGITYIFIPAIPSFRVSWIIGFTFRGLGTGLFLFATMNYLASFLPKEVVSKAIALITVFYNVVLAIGDLFVPMLVDVIGYRWIFIAIAICNFASIIFLFLSKEKQEQKKAIV